MKTIHYVLIAAAVVVVYFLFFRSSGGRTPPPPIPLEPKRPVPPVGPPPDHPPSAQDQINALTKTYCQLVAEAVANPSLQQKLKPEIVAIAMKLASLGLRTQPQC